MTTYTVTAQDSETPIALPPTAHVVRLLGQDSGKYTVAITTSDPTTLEAALEADATVISYEATTRPAVTTRTTYDDDPTTYTYQDISHDGQRWINDLRDCDGFPTLDPAEMSAEDRDTLAAYLREPDPALSDDDNAFSASVADEIEALDQN